GAAQEERGRGEVDNAVDAELSFDDFEAADPETGGLVILLRLLLVVALELVRFVCARLLAVAVVGLVVENEESLDAQQVRHYSLEHLAFGFQRVQGGAATLEKSAIPLCELQFFAEFKCVVVGDDDLRLA